MTTAAPKQADSHASIPYRDILDALPAAVYTTDAEGQVTFFNRAAQDLAGRTPEIGQDRWCISWRLYDSAGALLPLDRCPMAMALKQGSPVRNIEVTAERPDGARVPLMPFPTPLHDESGAVIGAINMLIDISALKRAEATAARRADEQAALYRFTDRLFRAERAEDVFEAALDAICAALDCTRASVLLCDDAGVMRFRAVRNLSQAYQDAVSGHSLWKRGAMDPEPLHMDDIAKADLDEGLRATIMREGIGALAFIPLMADGGVIGKFMVYHDASHAFSAGELDLALTIARQLGFAIERDRGRLDRAQAEEVKQQLISIVECSEDAIVSKDLNGAIVSWNKGAERLFGYTPDEIIGRSVTTLIPPEYQDEEPNILGRIRRGERIEYYDTVRRHKNGERIHVSLTVSPVKDAQGRIIGASKIARDVSGRKRADRQRMLLINELNHRVKNTLATVQSLAMQTLRNTDCTDAARALLDSRLGALSRAHDLLTAKNWEGAGLRDVVERALAPFVIGEHRVSIKGPELRVSPKQALALSIVLHELATNAVKYGALSNDAGRVAIAWTTETGAEHPEMHLAWTESGGPRVAPPTRLGFGSRLIERNLAHELGGAARIEYRPEGVVATISSPLEPADADGSLTPW